MENRRLLGVVFLSLCITGALAHTLSARIATFVEFKRAQPSAHTYTSKTLSNSFVEDAQVTTESLNAKCLQRENGACVVCGIDTAINTSVSHKTRTPLLTCRGMKPGPAKLIMETHAEPAIAGLWEVELGLGYHTSSREECPHQFIASNNPPIRAAYEIGPISVDGDIPPDGIIRATVCVGLSSARVGNEGKETWASLKISKLKIVSAL